MHGSAGSFLRWRDLFSVRHMPPISRILIPVLLLAACGGGGWWLAVSRAPLVERTAEPVPVSITAAVLQPAGYRIRVPSQGIVRARTESTVIPEISGTILEISPAFREGGFFEQGEVLVKIDPRDYESAVTIAASTVAQEETAVAEEEARAAQNLEDWKRLGRTGEPGPLVARVPQLAESRARLASAKAALERARRDLERCELKAPFAGCVLTKTADVGQYVSPGRELTKTFAVDTAEVSLPVLTQYLEFLDVPESFRGENSAPVAGPEVTLEADWAGRSVTWTGRVVRTAGAVDVKTTQMSLIAQVDDPYRRRAPDQPPLKVGMWVEARIAGRTVPDVFIIPPAALREDREVLIVDAENRLRRRPVTVLWKERDHVVIRDGLKAGEVLCTVSLQYAVEGLLVKPAISDKALPRPDSMVPPAAPAAPPAAAASPGPANGPRAG